MKVYAFDVDETLEIGGGPIKLTDLINLHNEGNIIGLCGNWAIVTMNLRGWHKLFSFLGPMGLTKEEFLRDQLLRYIPYVDEVVMVGNILGITGRSDDCGSARRAQVRFISENDFAGGVR